MALDTFNPYLFVSAGEQSNKFLTPAYSGGIVSFQAQRAQSLTGLTVRIDPIQEGTGDPSPSNVRPISGRTGMTVTAAGKNLIPFPYASQAGTYSGITVTVNTDGTLVLNGTATANVFFNLIRSDSPIQLPAGRYILHKPCATNIESIRLEIQKNGSWWSLAANNDVPLTLTESADISLYVRVSSGATMSNVKVYPMLEVGASATAYEPYVGQTYPVTWETEAGTVYGGTLDVVSGVLTVDKKLHTVSDADSTTLWNTGPNANRLGIKVEDSKTSQTVEERLNIICNIAKADISILKQSLQAVGTCCLYSGGTATYSIALFGVPTSEDTAEKAKAWLIAKGCAFVYPLATPQTYQLTPTEVRTLPGFNQVYSDAGPVIDIKF